MNSSPNFITCAPNDFDMLSDQSQTPMSSSTDWCRSIPADCQAPQIRTRGTREHRSSRVYSAGRQDVRRKQVANVPGTAWGLALSCWDRKSEYFRIVRSFVRALAPPKFRRTRSAVDSLISAEKPCPHTGSGPAAAGSCESCERPGDCSGETHMRIHGWN